MRRARVLALVATLATGLAPVAHAQGIRSPAFATLSGGARAYALSGAVVALSDDASAAFLNPARLAFVRGPSFEAGYARLVEGLPSDRAELAYAQPLGEPIAAPFQREGAYRYVLAAAAEVQRLELSQGSNYSEFTGTLAASIAPANIVAFGAALRGLHTGSDVDGLTATGLALDLGFSMALHPNLEAAITAHNVAGRVRYEGREKETPGRSFHFALAFARWRWAQVETDYVTEYNDASSVAAGVELLPEAVISLRGGVRHWMHPEARTVPSAGVGFRHKGLFLDYAARFDEQDALGLQHRISIGLRP
jgi:hypothetical protein